MLGSICDETLTNFLCTERLARAKQTCLENLLSLEYLPYLNSVAKGRRYRGVAKGRRYNNIPEKCFLTFLLKRNLENVFDAYGNFCNDLL